MFGVHVDGWTYIIDPDLQYTHFTGNDQWTDSFPDTFYPITDLDAWLGEFV